MQVGEVTFEALGLPPWTLTLLIVVVLLGFPIALVLAWAFEVTPEGIRKDSAGLKPDADEDPPELDQSAPSIAVLPFNDMSEHGDQAYFCEGIAEEILNALCKVANLRVASRVTAFRFGSKGSDVREIGRKLKVQTVLEGSVRKSGDRLRITAQLVKTADGYHLWSRQYDRRLEDIFEIQEEIADSIANALSVTLKRKTPSEQQPVDPKAYDLFLRGLSFFAKQNIQDTVYARQMFQQALEVDPQFGRAWAGPGLHLRFRVPVLQCHGCEPGRGAAHQQQGAGAGARSRGVPRLFRPCLLHGAGLCESRCRVRKGHRARPGELRCLVLFRPHQGARRRPRTGVEAVATRCAGASGGLPECPAAVAALPQPGRQQA